MEAGYWQLYRFNPMLKEEGKNPFTLDSKEPTGSYHDFITGETRYRTLQKMFPRMQSICLLAQKRKQRALRELQEKSGSELTSVFNKKKNAEYSAFFFYSVKLTPGPLPICQKSAVSPLRLPCHSPGASLPAQYGNARPSAYPSITASRFAARAASLLPPLFSLFAREKRPFALCAAQEYRAAEQPCHGNDRRRRI